LSVATAGHVAAVAVQLVASPERDPRYAVESHTAGGRLRLPDRKERTMGYDRNDDYRGGYGRTTENPYSARSGNGHEPDRGRFGRDRFNYGPNDRYRFSAQRDDYRNSRDHDHDRGFFERAGDEVRSWFGDDDAERRRERDAIEDERNYRHGGTGYGDYRNRPQQRHDPVYHDWRQRQIDALDRDYDEYRREHQSRFDNEFHGWRSQRQTQRSALDRVEEHMEVVGSDGEHIGKVDKVRGDRIVLTRNDTEAGGHHHSIPSSWIDTIDDKVKIKKSSIEAKTAWRDEDRNAALFGDQPNENTRYGNGPRNLNRAFSGTY
jgi:hypothetical protein